MERTKKYPVKCFSKHFTGYNKNRYNIVRKTYYVLLRVFKYFIFARYICRSR